MAAPHDDEKDSGGLKEKNDSLGDVHVLNAQEVGDEAIDDLTAHGDVTKNELLDLEDHLESMPLERTIRIIRQLYKLNKHIQTFDTETLFKMEDFLKDDVQQNPDKYRELVHEMRLEALLAVENSPYSIVRAVVDPTDDQTMPALTLRVWVIGIVFGMIGAFINQLFSIRLPTIGVGVSTAQLLAYPVGKFFAKVLPDWGFTLFGKRHSLNPGPFNPKEHMLITIMANSSFGDSYAAEIIITQAMPFWYNQAFARGFGYQLVNTLAVNIAGYGMAGMIRRFVVYPSFAIHPGLLATLALNKAFHADDSNSVPGPFGRLYNWSRMKLFYVAFGAMFVYSWFPNFIWQNLSVFNWMSWIAPHNKTYNMFVNIQFNSGFGLNPWPTFDWNRLGYAPDFPLFTAVNDFIGLWIAFVMVAAFYFTNAFNTSYFTITSNRTFDNRGKKYNVTRILDDNRLFDEAKYQTYSEPYMSAGTLNQYFWFFAAYSAMFTYAAVYHHNEIAYSFRVAYREFKNNLPSAKNAQEEEDADDLAEDSHARHMRNYKEVPEWWYFILLLAGLALGMAGVGAFPTGVTMAVVIFGIILTAIFIIPIGILSSVASVGVGLNVLAEFLGGAFYPGNALAMNYFKMYGVMTCSQALGFAGDLKLAHYTHIGQRLTFTAQIVATVLASFVQAGIYNFMMSFKDVCTDDAAFKMTCPGQNTFFTAAVFWGTLGPKRVFGLNGRYRTILIGFAVGPLVVLLGWALKKLLPRSKAIRNFHPVAVVTGAIAFSQTNMSITIPSFYLILISWGYLKNRYLAFWSRYNYILIVAFNTAIAIASVIQFFGLSIPEVSIDWWGNDLDKACALGGCPRFEIPAKGYFGPEKGHFN
ncbi:hypothetical protein Q8F55_005410 [Vanrija albida]|uniref:OPT family small oligopeptide transporter n=1 Tax=Vanrija albida TaxID=181172 RepID=A0ABR3Q1W3_9TREE